MSKFTNIGLLSFMVTTRLCYPILEKYWLLKLELTEVQTGEILCVCVCVGGGGGSGGGGDTLISECFKSKF